VKIKIDKEFSSWIPPMQPEEFEQLKASILSDGCRDALVIWAEEGLLIDGHNRYRICTENDIPFTTHKMSFDDRDDVFVWIFNNQMGRRNLQPIDKIPMLDKMKPIFERQAKKRQQDHAGTAPGKSKTLPIILPEVFKGDTRDQLGAAIGVSGATYERLKDVIENGVPELVDAVRKKEVSSLNARLISRMEKDKQKEVISGGKEEMKKTAAIISGVKNPIKIFNSTNTVQTYSDAMDFVDYAICQLERIQKTDPKYVDALTSIINWATSRIKERQNDTNS